MTLRPSDPTYAVMRRLLDQSNAVASEHPDPGTEYFAAAQEAQSLLLGNGPSPEAARDLEQMKRDRAAQAKAARDLPLIGSGSSMGGEDE